MPARSPAVQSDSAFAGQREAFPGMGEQGALRVKLLKVKIVGCAEARPARFVLAAGVQLRRSGKSRITNRFRTGEFSFA